jgi:putative membrane protein
MENPARRSPGPLVFWSLVALVFLWSGHRPFDRFTWVLEVAPAVLGAGILWATRRRFPFTPTVLFLIGLHMVILMIGGHYTYARVPLFDGIRDVFGLARNHYDRLGHFAQGFVPALIAREILIRRSPLKPGAWLFFLVCCVALSLSAVYELVEWRVSVATGSAGDAFLGTQGDPWDTQWDMALALIGAVAAQIALARRQDREMSRRGRP